MVTMISFCLLAFVLLSCCAFFACCLCLISLQPGDLPYLIWCLIMYLLYCMIELSEITFNCYCGRLWLFGQVPLVNGPEGIGKRLVGGCVVGYRSTRQGKQCGLPLLLGLPSEKWVSASWNCLCASPAAL